MCGRCGTYLAGPQMRHPPCRRRFLFGEAYFNLFRGLVESLFTSDPASVIFHNTVEDE